MEEDDLTFDSDEMEAIDDTSGEMATDEPAGGIVSYVQERFSKAETARETEEQRWIQAYRNYRVIYGPDVQFTSSEKSRVFVKVTKTKVLAAYGQIVEVLLGNNKFPLSINPTTLPEGVEESVYMETNQEFLDAKAQTGQPEGLPKLLPGETMSDLKERLGPLKKDLKGVENLNEGPGKLQSQITFEPAMVAA